MRPLFSTQRRRDAEVFDRVEHVERVEGGGKPQIGTNQHKSEGGICEDMCGFVVNSRVEHVEDLEMGFHPIPRMRANQL